MSDPPPLPPGLPSEPTGSSPVEGDGGLAEWARRPPEGMLITPLLAGLGGLLAFAAVVIMVVVLPVNTYSPPASADWAPLSSQAVRGRQTFTANGCYVCHSGFTRPQDVRQALYYLYPKVSQPGDFFGSDQLPNVLGTERTGPDLSQESGWHPFDWQYAHFFDPRFTDPLSLMPDFQFLSDRQVQDLSTYVETRSGKSGLLRLAGTLFSKHVVLTVQGLHEAPPGFSPTRSGKFDPAIPDKQLPTQPAPPSTQIPESANLSQIDRSYWLSANPLPITDQNLLEGKRVFQDRCVGCHGLAGDGKGPAARFLSPPPADFTSADDACCGGDTGPGDFYYRILRGWPGTAMENFGDRLSVDDIWRVTMFIKTIPKGGLKKPVPTTDMYIPWAPSKDLLGYLGHERLQDNPSFVSPTRADPYLVEAVRDFPGLNDSDRIIVPGLSTPLSLRDAAAGIKTIYTGLLDRAWADARARGDKLPPESQKAIPPTVPGQQ